jgi:ribosomal protein L37AE/L43A
MKWSEFSATEMGAMYDTWNDRMLGDYLSGYDDETGEDPRQECENCHAAEAVGRAEKMWLCTECLKESEG